MIKTHKNNGFSFVELVVVIAVLAVLAAILAPLLFTYTENSRMQKDFSTMDELSNAIQLSLSDATVFDEVYEYAIPNNYMTYTDSSGNYAQQIVDAEYWAPDGCANGVTITFNPEDDGTYDLSKGIVNDMTYGNGSVGEKRTAEGDLKQCYFEEMGNQLFYSSVKQSVGQTLQNNSATYKNSSYTVFIRFYVVDGTRKVDISGAFNGTNLSLDSPAAIVENTTDYTPESKPTTRPASQGNAQFTQSDLSGGGSMGGISNRPSYKPLPPIPEGGVYYVGVKNDSYYSNVGNYDGYTVKYEAGEPFPETPKNGDVYVYGDYEYRYNAYFYVHWTTKVQDGWGVKARVSKTTYNEILTEISEKPIVNMFYTFYGQSNMLYSPTIPSTVTDMSYAFHGCTNLQDPPIIPNGVINLQRAFQNCKSLRKGPTIPSTVRDMQHTFAGCTSLVETPEILSGIETMYATFFGCSSLTTISPLTIPDSVSQLNQTFYGCSGFADLSDYTLPGTVLYLNDTFQNCVNLTDAPQISNGTINLVYAFRNCSSLIHAPELPNSIKSMNGTFWGCSSLTTPPQIPNNVTNMSYAFYGCASLTNMSNFILPDSVVALDKTFAGCTSLTNAPSLPKGATSITSTFSNCTSLIEAPIIPDNVYDIRGIFQGCTSLQTVPLIPSRVKYMDNAFSNCTSLAGDIVINATPSSYKDCLKSTQISSISGSCGIKTELLKTK